MPPRMEGLSSIGLRNGHNAASGGKSMREWVAYLFVAVLLSFAMAVLYRVHRFHLRSLRRWSIHRADLWRTTRQVIKYAIFAWPTLALILLGINLWERQQGFDWVVLLLCLVGPLLFSLAAVWSQAVVLRGIYRLPIVNGGEDEGS